MIAKQPLGPQFEIVALEADTPTRASPCACCSKASPSSASACRSVKKSAAVTRVADGTATITPAAGPNQLRAVRRVPVANDARSTSMSWEHLLALLPH
ncbi:hypothetical protein [Acidovorax sp. sic0104]|nr:hypothetical protein [Acidovorax sp. sic0104]